MAKATQDPAKEASTSPAMVSDCCSQPFERGTICSACHRHAKAITLEESEMKGPEDICAAHTAGPWQSEGQTVFTFPHIPSNVIARCLPMGHLKSKEEAAANARLIAAAPELLEALRLIRDCGLRPECLSQAEAAIAKAEGTF